MHYKPSLIKHRGPRVPGPLLWWASPGNPQPQALSQECSPRCFLRLALPLCSALSLWGFYREMSYNLFWGRQPAGWKVLKKQSKKISNLPKTLTGFVFQKRKKERKKTCLPDSLASVILLLEPTYQVFFLNYPFFLVRWGLGLSDSNPLKGQTPAVPLPPLWDGSKGHSPAYHLPFCNISHQNHLLSNNFTVTLNAYFGIICLSNVCFIANQKASQLLVSFKPQCFCRCVVARQREKF